MQSKLNFSPTTFQAIIQKVGFIDSFKSKWFLLEKEDNVYLKELKQLATVQSIGSSTRIEGATLTDEKVSKLINNLKITKFETRDEQEVVGYYETLSTILESHAHIPVTESNLKFLHNLLLKQSDKDQHHRGNYKQLSNKVVANYPDGTQKVIFNTTDPHLTQVEMEKAANWVNQALTEKTHHPLIAIAAFIYEFLSINPFQDGNGRMSRLMTTLLLLQNGYSFIQYISLEHVIEARKSEYYQALIAGQKNWRTERELIEDWVVFFLECMESVIKRLEEKYERYQIIGQYIPMRHKEILKFISENQPVKVGDLDQVFEDVTIHTLKKDLQAMVKNGMLEKVGKGKMTVYIVR